MGLFTRRNFLAMPRGKEMKTYLLTFAVKSDESLEETALGIEGVVHDAIKDCALQYEANLIRSTKCKEEN